MTCFRTPALITFVLCLFGLGTVAAQNPPTSSTASIAASETPAWGLASLVVHTLTAHEFKLTSGTAGPLDVTTTGATCLSPSCFWFAGLQLPSGAEIRNVEVSACDSDSFAGLGFALYRGPRLPGPVTELLPLHTSGGVETPGCSTFLGVLPTPHTVDNGAEFYFLRVSSGGTVHWNQVRIRYRLKVSPAPGTATFSDVPVSHPQFQFIEALAASGITGGCGGGNYCPDTPVTRGQMAVFLAAALGLHFPN